MGRAPADVEEWLGIKGGGPGEGTGEFVNWVSPREVVEDGRTEGGEGEVLYPTE